MLCLYQRYRRSISLFSTWLNIILKMSRELPLSPSFKWCQKLLQYNSQKSHLFLAVISFLALMTQKYFQFKIEDKLQTEQANVFFNIVYQFKEEPSKTTSYLNCLRQRQSRFFLCNFYFIILYLDLQFEVVFILSIMSVIRDSVELKYLFS